MPARHPYRHRGRLDRASDRFRTEVIGRSAEGRPIVAILFGGDPSSGGGPRTLVVAGQHGDEPASVEAALDLAERARTQELHAALAIVPCANPDGWAAGSRHVSSGRDLNRDHLLLETPEARVLHRFARRFQPDLAVDVHTFKGRRRALLDLGCEHAADILLELSTHAQAAPHYEEARRRLLAPLLSDLHQGGIRAGRYVLWRSGRVRTSTTDRLDLRNGLAGRVGAWGLLVEAREASRRQDAAPVEALSRTLRWLTRTSTLPPLRAPGDQPVTLDVRRRRGGQIDIWMVQCDASEPPLAVRVPVDHELVAERLTALPRGYMVPSCHRCLHQVLERHGFAPAPLPGGIAVWEAQLDGPRRSRHAGRPFRAVVSGWQRVQDSMRDHIFYPAPPDHPGALAALLDPRARHGLARYPSLVSIPDARGVHPIKRVVMEPDSRAGSLPRWDET